MADPQVVLPSNHTVEEAYRVLGISPNPDGSLTREIRIPMVNATPYVDPTKPAPVALSKDVISGHKVCMRLFRPLNPPASRKLPLIIYMHGGDFVLFSATTIVFHNFCNNIAAQIPAIFVSVEYRLAPEHRLPAAYDDAMAGVFWVRQQALGIHGHGGDPWLTKYADFKRVFLLGSASGGNIAYHIALRALNFNLQPLRIKGLIMNQPYFGGVRRTRSELRLIEDPYVPLYVNDVLWTLALPLNATRDHEFCNPTTLGSDFGRVKKLPRTMVKGNSGDPLVDRGKRLVKLLKANGVEVVSKVVRGGYHGIELNSATAAQKLYDSIKAFVLSTD
ncbi:Arylacetamide deacetylase [Handroanthus impetiginosus]|uniref:Arylacetamide deacetylase n=1 Tax=Handroanthus impetiginosus TaxID=429701 RepID=A0A2G9GV24_9LAMI|nr:Arylacetamide deacetylase [Handroanthus impetiginosus]